MLVRHEIYDQNGLVKVEYFENNMPTIEEQIQQKEEELLKMYNELLALKAEKENQ